MKKRAKVVTACKPAEANNPLRMNSEKSYLDFEAVTAYGSIWITASIAWGKFNAFNMRNVWLASLAPSEHIIVKRSWRPSDVLRQNGSWQTKDIRWPTLERWFVQANTLEAIVLAEYFVEDIILILETLESNRSLKTIGLNAKRTRLWGTLKV